MNKFFSKRVHFLAFILLFISIFVLIDTIFNEKNRISGISIESDMHFLEMHLASLDEDIGNRLYDYDMHMTQGSVLFSYRENLMKKDNKYIVLNASQIKGSENFAYKYSQDFKKNKIQKESCHGDFYRVIDMFYSNKNSFRNHKDSLILEKILDENNQELYEIVIKHELTKGERIKTIAKNFQKEISGLNRKSIDNNLRKVTLIFRYGKITRKIIINSAIGGKV